MATDPASSAAFTSSSNNYQVFLNFRGPDHIQKHLATDLYRRLRDRKLRVFPDVEKLQERKNITQIKSAIRAASVHIAIFSLGYAASQWCLEELSLMLESGATIIPVFYGVELLELRRPHESDPGLYTEALHTMETEGVNSEITGKWRTALDVVSQKEGLHLKSYNSDERQLVNAIVEAVETNICRVFINRGPDVLKTFGSHLYHHLLFYIQQRVFMDKEEFREGDSTPQSAEAIKQASVHIAIFSKNYAESSCCLNELVSMYNQKFESKGIIIPVFYGVKPSEVRWQIGAYSKLRWQNVGVYDLFQRMLRCSRNKNGDGALATNRVDPATRGKWKKTLSNVADISGFEREACNGDDGLLVKKIVKRVLSFQTPDKYDVFISHSGPDSKKTLASHLYHRLVASGYHPFLDMEELIKGQKLDQQIDDAIRSASVHIVIFSPNYTHSSWCMDELKLMLQTGAVIIPVFYNVEKSHLLEKCHEGNVVYARALQNLKDKIAFDSKTHYPILTRLYYLVFGGGQPRHCIQKIEKWSEDIFNVAEKSDFFSLKDYEGDEGPLLDEVVQRVAELVSRRSDDDSNWFRSQIS